MLTIVVKGEEFYDSESEEFVYPEAFELQLEHSLAALSKWEAKYKKPYLKDAERTAEEALGYVEAMCVTPNPPAGFVHKLSQDNINEISAYINDAATATWFRDTPSAPSREIVTAEIIYHWIFSAGLPLAVEHWHLNKLFAQIRVFSIKNDPKPKKKINTADSLRERNRLNEMRRQAAGTTG